MEQFGRPVAMVCGAGRRSAETQLASTVDAAAQLAAVAEGSGGAQQGQGTGHLPKADFAKIVNSPVAHSKDFSDKNRGQLTRDRN